MVVQTTKFLFGATHDVFTHGHFIELVFLHTDGYSKPDHYSLLSPSRIHPWVYTTKRYPLQYVNRVHFNKDILRPPSTRGPLITVFITFTPHLVSLRHQRLRILSLQIPISNKRQNVRISLVLHALTRLAEPRGNRSSKDLERLDDAVNMVIVREPISFLLVHTPPIISQVAEKLTYHPHSNY